MKAAWAAVERDLMRIGGPQALGTTTLVAIAVFMAAVTLFWDILSTSWASPLGWGLTGLVSIVLVTVFLLACRRILLPVHPRPSRPVLALAVFAAAGAIRNVTVNGIASAFDLPQQASRPVLLSVAMSMVVMSLAALTASRHAEHRTTSAELVAERRHLVSLGNSFERKVAESEAELLYEVHRQLDPAMAEITGLLSSEGDSSRSGATTEALLRTVSEVVRPMSHRLNSAMPASAVLEDAAFTPPTAAADDQTVDVKAAIRPVATAAVIVFLTLSYFQAGLEYVPRLFVGMALMTIFTAGLLALARALWPASWRVPAMLPALGTLLALNALVGIALTGMALLLIPRLFGEARAASELLSMERTAAWLGLSVSLIGFGLSALQVAQVRLLQVEQDLRDVNAQLEIAVAQLRGQLWANRRNLSWVLHGPVQSTLLSAAMELSQPDLTAADRERIKGRIDAAITVISSENRRVHRLEDAVREIAVVWEFSCRIHSHVDPAAAIALADDPTTTLAVIEVIREGIGNAIRHGDASQIDLSVVEHGRLVRVEIRDNGTGLPAQPRPGLGSAILDEVCLSWLRTSDPDGTVLTAELPLQ